MRPKPPSPDETSAEAVNEAAATWFARREAGSWREADQLRLDEWLDQDAAHRIAYLRLRATWDRTDALRGRTAASNRVAGRWRETVAAPLRRRAWVGVGLAACVAISLGLVFGMPSPSVSINTPVGGRAVAPLSDGSTVDLNTDTQLRVVVNETRRNVSLERGEAYFDVAHRPDLPFVIQAGDRTITVLGTRFSVRRIADQTVVMVEEGRVRVTDHDKTRVLAVGDELIADGQGMTVIPVGADRIAADLAWRTGRLVFQDVTLAQAAVSFNRYSESQIVVVDPRISSLRIGGSFQTGRVDQFVEALTDVYGLDVENQSGRIIVKGPRGG